MMRCHQSAQHLAAMHQAEHCPSSGSYRCVCPRCQSECILAAQGNACLVDITATQLAASKTSKPLRGQSCSQGQLLQNPDLFVHAILLMMLAQHNFFSSLKPYHRWSCQAQPSYMNRLKVQWILHCQVQDLPAAPWSRIVLVQIQWVTFHSGYDFGYLLKLLTCQSLPATESEFFTLLKVRVHSPKHSMHGRQMSSSLQGWSIPIDAPLNCIAQSTKGWHTLQTSSRAAQHHANGPHKHYTSASEPPIV